MTGPITIYTIKREKVPFFFRAVVKFAIVPPMDGDCYWLLSVAKLVSLWFARSFYAKPITATEESK